MHLGIDLGTSGLKLVLLDDEQRVAAMADVALERTQPAPGWSEQDPRDWWAALEAGVHSLRAREPHAWGRVRDIGLSGQMHGAVLLDAGAQPLRPAILWNDARSQAECAELEQLEPSARTVTGNLAMPGFTAPKLLWVRRHEPEVFARVRRVLLPKDWLRLGLTGEFVSDLSDASGTLWLDVGARAWSEPMLAACGLSLAHMPRLVEGNAISGGLRAALAARWGLQVGIPVAGGGGDNAASAVGVGVVRAGEGLVSLGTSGVVFLADAAFHPAPERAVHAFAHALPGRWHQMSVMLSAASALAWAARLLGRAEADLGARVAALGHNARRRAPLFLPYLMGERSPHNDASARGLLFGLQAGHGADDVAYAVMEGVAFGLMDGLATLRAAGAPPTRALTLVGGGARSKAWCELLASGLGCVMLRPAEASTAAAVGAARLGWLAAGGVEDEICVPPERMQRFDPDAGQAELMAARHARYRALYPALRAEHRAMEAITA
jgi:xylulokinase